MGLIVVDLDYTITDGSDERTREFYRTTYHDVLSELVWDKAGEDGRRQLHRARERKDGLHGISVLIALGIPLSEWFERVKANARFDLIPADYELVELWQNTRAHKVLYTANLHEMVLGILRARGFDEENDFDKIISWHQTERMPLKWTCSFQLFRQIMNRFEFRGSDAWSVGDTWETDLEPAQRAGFRTVQIGNKPGSPEMRFEHLREFLIFLQQR